MTLRETLARRARDAFGPSFFAFLGVAAACGALSYYVNGAAVFTDSLGAGADLLLALLPRICAALLIAGFVSVLLPREFIARWVGRQAGLGGILLGELAGICTPGGPVTAFSLIAALKVAGADRAVLIAYAGGWSLLGVQRIVIWELPLLGADFVLTRLAVTAPLPILAALIARRIPIALDPSERAGG